MKTERILLPIDIRKCPLEIFPFVNDLAARCDTIVTLLHVVTLNILAPESRIYDELAAEAHFFLECLAQEYLPAAASTSIRVRFGRPADEVINQSREEIVDLIVLPNDGSSLLRRLSSVWKRCSNTMVSPLVEKLVREANCAVIVFSAKGHLDCETAWGRPGRATADAAPTTALMGQASLPGKGNWANFISGAGTLSRLSRKKAGA